MSQTLVNLGCKRADADALPREFPLEDIRRQIEWLPHRNARNVAWWLPIYIREGWPTPKPLAEEEERRQRAATRESAGLTAAEQRDRERRGREMRAARRQEYLDRLPPDRRAALDAEAGEALLREGFWRDYVREKGVDGRSYREALRRELDKIVDGRLDCPQATAQATMLAMEGASR